MTDHQAAQAFRKSLGLTLSQMSELTSLHRAKFESLFIPEPNSGCWLWAGAAHSCAKGYGSFRLSRKTMKAHCAAYELYRGPRNGLFVLHHCDNIWCVNPDHLYLGTQTDNVRDRERRQRRAPPKGELNPNAKLSVADVQAIRLDPRSFAAIARAYGVGETAIAYIKKGKSWRHLP